MVAQTFDWAYEIGNLDLSAPDKEAAEENIALVSQDKDGEGDPQEINLALMAHILSAPVHGLTPDEVSSVFCTPECRGKVESYRLQIEDLLRDFNDLKRQNQTFKKNDKIYKEKIESQKKDIAKLKEDFSAKNTNYQLDLAIMSELVKELEVIKQQYQINELNLKKFDNSNRVFRRICDLQLDYKQ
jgi:predicted nuclease with TOPRIM domain